MSQKSKLVCYVHKNNLKQSITLIVSEMTMGNMLKTVEILAVL